MKMKRATARASFLTFPSLDTIDMKDTPTLEPSDLLVRLIFFEAYRAFITDHLVVVVQLKGHIAEWDNIRQRRW